MKTGGKSLLTNSIGKRLSELQSDSKVFGIITVDLVREPTKISISAAQSFVENLKAEPGVTECMIAPGNHDVKRILGNVWHPDECSQAFGLKGAVWHKIFQPAGLVLFRNVRLSACLSRHKFRLTPPESPPNLNLIKQRQTCVVAIT